MEIFVARQPIFDKDKNTYAYELLFRESLKNYFPDIDGNEATSKLLTNTFFAMGINKITGNKPGFINFTKDLLISKTATIFPNDKIVVEILENVEPEILLVESIKELKAKGYTIALDDFIFQEKFRPLIELSDIIKFDIMETPLESISNLVSALKTKYPKLTLLAEKVETYKEFEMAKKMGFHLFQGYFFAKPEIISNKSIPNNKASLLKLVSEVNRSQIDTIRLTDLIKQDVSVAYKLLKFINSAYFKRLNEISTIKDAVTFLGIQELKKFVNLIAAAGINDDKPPELLTGAVIRARMCELIGNEFKTDFSSEELFTIGLFSMMDAMLDKTMEDIFNEVQLSDKLVKALLGNSRDFNLILNGVICFENGDWSRCELIKKTNLDIYDKLALYHMDALKMASEFK